MKVTDNPGKYELTQEQQTLERFTKNIIKNEKI